MNRVVITGLGWVTPMGYSIDGVWKRLLNGESGIARTTLFDASTFPTTFSAQVKQDYRLEDFVPDLSRHPSIGRNTRFALGACAQAWQMAGLPGMGSRKIEDGRQKTEDRMEEREARSQKPEARRQQEQANSCEPGKHAVSACNTAYCLPPTAYCPSAYCPIDLDRVGIYLGSGEGSLDFAAYTGAALAAWGDGSTGINSVKWAQVAREFMNPTRELEQEPNMPLSHLALLTGARGPAFNCLTACAASTQAIGEAAEILRRGDADVMIGGGAHSMIHPFGVTGFNRLTALSTFNEDPVRASRPFDAQRGGFVLGEGAGMVILETLEHAQNRGANILAEVVGYGSTADAYRITDQDPNGLGAVVAMREALADAGLTPADIHYINAHGTGTRENDGNETVAIKTIFGERAKNVPISSIKSMMGHLIAAAGAVELITCVLAIRDNVLPPTMNLDHPDPECDLDYVPNRARPARVDVAMSNSFGFGGQNDTIIVKRF